MVDMRAFDECFAGNTPKMKTITAQFIFFLNQKGFGPQLGGSGCNRQTTRTAADDTDVIIVVWHEDFLYLRFQVSVFSPPWCDMTDSYYSLQEIPILSYLPDS
jgi:hypothetical protein